ncbi:MAG: tRNA lysidine(34) synthetase TilS [Bacteroidales bacterium]|jgi:tRNA(Ile)-lysidine synthase|nr:tRNA lysidine(34) synthetase TilS [Bacteroidales bacterium]
MKEKFHQELIKLIPDIDSAKFLLAVSGGRDSVALAHLCANSNISFDIAHCNFHLRGEESNREMVFVQKLPFLTLQKVFVKEFDTLSVQQYSGKSIEMIARELRYRWFEEIGKDYDYIVTAHHANDNAETVLLNFLRGTGLRGMCGIPQKNEKIIRPLLRFSASEIDNYVREQGIEFCVDSSNISDDFLRNRIRHYIIPEIEKIYPNCVDTFTKNSSLFLQQTKFLDTSLKQIKERLISTDNHQVKISIDLLKNIENQSVVLYEILQLYGFNTKSVDNILQSVTSNSGKKFISETHILLKDRNYFIIEEKNINNNEVVLIHSVEELENYRFSVKKLKNNGNLEIEKVSNLIYVDANKIQFPLTLRNWKNGDYFYPFGMKRKKKVSDYFTDLKIDLFEKQKIRLLCSQNQIVWVINYRADNRFGIDSSTKYYYRIEKK